MKKYVKPFILEEIIEIEDVIAVSPGGDVDVDQEEGTDIGDLFPTNPNN